MEEEVRNNAQFPGRIDGISKHSNISNRKKKKEEREERWDHSKVKCTGWRQKQYSRGQSTSKRGILPKVMSGVPRGGLEKEGEEECTWSEREDSRRGQLKKGGGVSKGMNQKRIN